MKNFYQSLLVFFLLFLLLSLSIHPVKAVYEEIINQPPEIVEITGLKEPVRQELERAVLEIVENGHMAPTVYEGGHGVRGIQFFLTPGETLYSLSLAFPYVSAEIQNKMLNFFTGSQGELIKYPVHSTRYYDRFSGKTSEWPGIRREYFPVDLLTSIVNNWPYPEVHSSVIYAVWLFSERTGSWNYANANYASLKNLYSGLKSQGIRVYADMAGVIGFARIANHFNQTADYQDALNFAETAFPAAENFNQLLTTANTLFPKTSHQYFPPVFIFYKGAARAFHFNPDIGRFLSSFAQIESANYADEINIKVPLAWLTAPAMTQGENAYATPDISWTYFMIKAYSEKESTQNLINLLDKPDRKGDLFYIQKLVAVLESESDPSQSSSPVPLKPGDGNEDGLVNGADYMIWFNHFEQTTDNGHLDGDYNNDGVVNGGDYMIWFNNFEG